MTMPYENQLIGAFVYAFGYIGGTRDAKTAAVNLFQQTPLDRSLSDLIVGAERCVVIEFKRSKDELDSEQKKWGATDLEGLLVKSGLVGLSRMVHFVVYGEMTEQRIALHACPYLDVLDTSLTPIKTSDAHVLISWLYDRLHNTDDSIGVGHVQLEKYLNWLAHYRSDTTDGSGRQPAWLVVANIGGTLVIRTADSLDQLMDKQPKHAPEPEQETRYRPR